MVAGTLDWNEIVLALIAAASAVMVARVTRAATRAEAAAGPAKQDAESRWQELADHASEELAAFRRDMETMRLEMHAMQLELDRVQRKYRSALAMIRDYRREHPLTVVTRDRDVENDL